MTHAHRAQVRKNRGSAFAMALVAIVATGGFIAATLPSAAAQATGPATVYTYPPAEPGIVTDTYFGTKVSDPYRWLEGPDLPATQQWIEAESSLTRRYLDSLPSRPQRTRQVDALLDMPVWGAPVVVKGRTFWTEQAVGANQPVLMTTEGSAKPRVLIDPSKIAGSGPVSLADWAVSPDGELVAWAASQSGSDWRTIRIVRSSDGTTLPDTIEHARFTGLWWTPDSRALAYQAYPAPSDEAAAATGAQLRYHEIGTPVSLDPVLMENPAVPSERYWICCSESESKVVYVISNVEWSYRWMPRLAPGQALTPLFTTPKALAPSIIAIKDRRIWMTESQRATTGQVVRVDVDRPQPESWATVVPATSDTLQDATAVGDRLVLTYLHDASSLLRITDLAGSPGPRVSLPGNGTVGAVTASPGSPSAYFTFSSFTRPKSVLSLDVRRGNVQSWRTPKVPFNPDDFVTTTAMVPSLDGTPVHVFISRRRDVVRNGTNPTLLYGYGGFNIPLTPEYSPEWLAWMQTGGVLVVANLRGGGEFGKAWYQAGTLLNKQRTFDDFIGAAEWLKERRWTDTARLAISGRSNGGLLIGAVITQRPTLAAVAIPQVGVLDMLRYHQFTIGASWAQDYGRSDDSPEMFQALYAYSPLHNVRPGVQYPATLITTAESDDRVVPAHSYKFAAALQRDTAGPKPVLIRIERGAGHGAGASRDQAIAQIADRLSFSDANNGTSPVIPSPTFQRTPASG